MRTILVTSTTHTGEVTVAVLTDTHTTRYTYDGVPYRTQQQVKKMMGEAVFKLLRHYRVISRHRKEENESLVDYFTNRDWSSDFRTSSRGDGRMFLVCSTNHRRTK